MSEFQIDQSPLPFELPAPVQAERAAIFAECEALNSAMNTLGESCEIYSRRIACHERLAAHCDVVDDAQREAVATAQIAVDAAEAAAKAKLIEAGVCTADTVWAFADKLGFNADVAAARDTLTRYREWTTSGTRQVNANGQSYCSDRYAELVRRPIAA